MIPFRSHDEGVPSVPRRRRWPWVLFIAVLVVIVPGGLLLPMLWFERQAVACGERTYHLQGKVVDKRTGLSVEGAELTLSARRHGTSSNSPPESIRPWAYLLNDDGSVFYQTDDTGKFSVWWRDRFCRAYRETLFHKEITRPARPRARELFLAASCQGYATATVRLGVPDQKGRPAKHAFTDIVIELGR